MADEKMRYSLFKKIVIYILLGGGGAIVLIPLVWMVSTSLKTWIQLPQATIGGEQMLDVTSFAKELWPNPVDWSNYPKALTTFPFLLYLKNTLIITGLAMLGVVISNPLIAYGFARLRAPGKNLIFLAYLGTMMLPGQVIMIPVYIMWAKAFHAIDTFAPLIVGSFFGSPFYVFLLRQFFMTIPRELSDAAKVDGCSEFQIFYKIMLPLLKPAVSVILIFTFMGHWNDFMGPLIYINSESKRTLALGLAFFTTSAGEQISLLNYQMAVAFLMTIPCLVIFYLSQRTFIQGIVFSGMTR